MNRKNSRDEEDNHQNEPPSKTRRTTRACLQCRNRKQRCDGPSATDPTMPCRRCCQLDFTCSFAQSPQENEVETSSMTLKKVDRLQRQLVDHQKRIEDLELFIRDVKSGSGSGTVDEAPIRNASISTPHINESVVSQQSPEILGHGGVNSDHRVFPRANTMGISNVVESPYEQQNSISGSLSHPTESSFTMDTVNLEAPMSTLRNLASLSKEKEKKDSVAWNMTYNPILPLVDQNKRERLELDPVALGILTMEEAQHAFDIYFSHCHPMAPFMCIQTQRSAAFVRQSSPALFISVCAVGARFWSLENSQSPRDGSSSQYRTLIETLDATISRLLLQPKLADVNLDHIRCLLLYIQWMPIEQHSEGGSHTRYNDISAWSVLGLAIRYSSFLNLERLVMSPFSQPTISTLTQEDFSLMRVWINLLTCDYHLMLSSGMPASLDPRAVNKIVRYFSAHDDALQPDDSRLAAVSELVGIIHRASKSSGDPSVRALDAASLKKANAEFDDWEHFWSPVLGMRDSSIYHKLPFTSLRWYRLAINSARLGSILSPSHGENSQGQVSLQLPMLQALDISLLSAAQIIFALSDQKGRTWTIQPQSLASFPRGEFAVDGDGLARFRYAVDSSWIAHSFAAVFLVLCYLRGVIDDELQILQLATLSSSHTSGLTIAPAPPRPHSLFYRLVSLASQIFETICRTSATSHPAAGFRTIIQNVFSVILKDGSAGLEGDAGVGVGGNGGMEEGSVDALFELMFSGNGGGYDWQMGGGGLF